MGTDERKICLQLYIKLITNDDQSSVALLSSIEYSCTHNCRKFISQLSDNHIVKQAHLTVASTVCAKIAESASEIRLSQIYEGKVP